MKSPSFRKTVVAALFAAITCAATLVVQIPIGATGGYINMGDAAVLFSAYLLGPLYGAAAGGIGSALADLLSGYALYAPATFIIKSCMAVVAGYLYLWLSKRAKSKAVAIVASGFCGEAVMILGYFLFTAAFVLKSVAGALPEVVGNLIQGAFGIIVSMSLLMSKKFKG